jgi:RNA polymerase sigma factor FliA
MVVSQMRSRPCATEHAIKEQRVLALYYYEELTMKEVGVALGIGESRVSQIHSLAMVRLRARLNSLGAPIARGKAAGIA